MPIINIFTLEYGRALKLLSETDPRTPEYSQLIDNLCRLGDLSEAVMAETPSDSVPDSPAETIRFPGVSDAKTETESPKPEEAPKKDGPKPEDVRKKLGDARMRGVNIAELIQQMGFHNFSSVPPERYQELLDAVEKAEAGTD